MWIRGFEFERFKDNSHNMKILSNKISSTWYLLMLLLTIADIGLIFFPTKLVSAKENSLSVKSFTILMLCAIWISGIVLDTIFTKVRKEYNIDMFDWDSSHRWMSSKYVEKLPRGRFICLTLSIIWIVFIFITAYKYISGVWVLGDILMYITIFIFIPTTPLLLLIGTDSCIGDIIEIFDGYILFYADDIDFKDSNDYFEVPTFVSTKFVRLKKIDKNTYILKILPDKPCYMIFDRDFVNYTQLTTDEIQNFSEGSVFDLNSIYEENIDSNFIYKENTCSGYDIILKRSYFTNFNYLIEDLKSSLISK